MIYIYEATAAEFESMGVCGALEPTRCEHEEVAGGLSELVLEHPLDAAGKFAQIQPGMVVKAPVPVRTTPEIAPSGEVVASVETWTVRQTASAAERALHSKPSGGSKKATLPQGLSVTVVLKSGDRYKVKAGKYGTGYVSAAALSMVLVTVLPPGDSAAIEQIEPAFSVRPQLFRIYELQQTDQSLIARARHISYDLLGNLTSYHADQPTASQALAGIMGGCAMEHPFEASTDIGDKRTEVGYTAVNPIKALLDPETGFLRRYGAQLVRDDFELFFLRSAGLDRGVRVEYAKNLLGLKCTLSWDELVTSIMPIGEDAEGNALLLVGNPILTSANASKYPIPRVLALNVPDAKVTKSVNANLARARLTEAAQSMFLAGCDQPKVSMSVDFVRLGDCLGLSSLKNLEDVFLYDKVTISHKPLGIEIAAEVVRMKFDCLRERVIQVELGSSSPSLVGGSIASWQVPSGISGGKILTGSISGAQLTEDAIVARHIAAEVINAGHIASNSIETGHLQAGSIVSEKIAAGAIEAGHIASNSINAEHIQAEALYAQKLVAAVSELISANIRQAEIGQTHIDWAAVVDLNALIGTVAKAQLTAAIIEEAQIQWAQIGSLSAAVAEIARAEIGEVVIDTAAMNQAEIRWAEIASLQAAVAEIAQASIGELHVDYARIVDMVTDTAIISEGIGGRLFINRLSVTEANMVSLTTGELVIKKDDGRFYALSVDDDGNVVAVLKTITGEEIETGSITGEQLADDSVPGGKLIENSITAREISVESLFADSAMIRAIKAMNIDVANLFADVASFGRVTANHLSSDVGASLDLRSNQSIRQLVEQMYMQLDERGVTIGSNDADAHFKVSIQPDQVAVLQDGVPIAYFKGNRMHAVDAELENQLRIGTWIIGLESDGGLSIYKL